MQSITINKTPKWLEMKFEFIRNKFHIQIQVDEEDPMVHEVAAVPPEPVVVIEHQIVDLTQETEDSVLEEESIDEKKRRKSEYRKRYYEANKEKFREYSRRRTQAKKAVKQPLIEDDISELTELESLVNDSMITRENNVKLQEHLEEIRQNYRDNEERLTNMRLIEEIKSREEETLTQSQVNSKIYYQNHLTEIRKYYQDNKERIAKKQQTDEAKAKFREQYHARRSNLTKQEIASKNAIAVAQRKVRDLKLKAKYPNCKTLKAAKVLKAAEDKARRECM